MSDIIRVMRLIEYVGPRELVEEAVRRAMHGSKVLGEHLVTGSMPREGNQRMSLLLRATTLGEFPDVIPQMQNLESECLKLENEILQKTIDLRKP